MQEEQIVNGIIKVLEKDLKLNNLIIKREMQAYDFKGWDSLAHIGIIISLEEEFKLRFSIGEITNLKNIGELIDLIKKKKTK